MLWILAAGTSLYDSYVDDASKSKLWLTAIGWLLSLFWSSHTIGNVAHATVAGSFASWYYLYPNYMPNRPTQNALKRCAPHRFSSFFLIATLPPRHSRFSDSSHFICCRIYRTPLRNSALTTSFGSIAFGSMAVAFVQSVRRLLYFGGQSDACHCEQGCRACGGGCVEGVLFHFNDHALSYISIYGRGFRESARDVYQLLVLNGVGARYFLTDVTLQVCAFEFLADRSLSVSFAVPCVAASAPGYDHRSSYSR